ncbi:MAG: sigma-54 dependent transcriptional regulator [Thermoguttaceae bacterium]|jgi:DNA-binding NtrC family response regulator|nr:sigma-54 dependent transcriptional regulator [Thermoguttaceae bacterium]
MTYLVEPAMPEIASILIVEDEEVVALDIACQLERMGYRVAGMARSGEDACREAADSRPDLVLMDISIEGEWDGVEAAGRIRQTACIPVVFLTAYSDGKTLRRARTAEPYGYIVKPFDQRDLQTAIEIALYKGEADRQLRRSRDDLQAILDAQRHGTLMLDPRRSVAFASRSARKLLGLHAVDFTDGPVGKVLRLNTRQLGELDWICNELPDARSKLAVTLPDGAGGERHLEIEVADDPRDAARKILFLYDVSSLHELRRQLDAQSGMPNILGKCKAMRQVFQLIGELARVHSTVLIEGESGTGKELVARAIHNQSDRHQGPFVALNCAGLGEELAASQLFGHRRGSFTGAYDDQAGLFEAADGGTLFLDEIGELPIRVQTSLLRVLEENAVLRLGESTLRPIDVRIIAATHRDLAREVEEKRFRHDLFYRIRVARVNLPPLRERRDDLPLLARAFLAQHRAATGKEAEAISSDAMGILLTYPWPGNVRELRNALEFAVICSRGSVIQPEDLPPEVLEVHSEESAAETASDEHDRILTALERGRGNRTRAAELLGISRATLYRRLRELGIDPP